MKALLSLVLGMGGIALILSVSWKLGLGIWLFVWGNNLSQKSSSNT